MVCAFSGGFCTTYRFAVTRLSPTLFSMTLQTWLPDAFHHLVQNDNFHCQTLWKTPKLTYLAVKNASWQIGLRIQIG